MPQPPQSRLPQFAAKLAHFQFLPHNFFPYSIVFFYCSGENFSLLNSVSSSSFTFLFVTPTTTIPYNTALHTSVLHVLDMAAAGIPATFVQLFHPPRHLYSFLFLYTYFESFFLFTITPSVHFTVMPWISKLPPLLTSSVSIHYAASINLYSKGAFLYILFGFRTQCIVLYHGGLSFDSFT